MVETRDVGFTEMYRENGLDRVPIRASNRRIIDQLEDDLEAEAIAIFLSLHLVVFPGEQIFSPDLNESDGKEMTLPDMKVVDTAGRREVFVEVGTRNSGRSKKKARQLLVAQAAGVPYVQMDRRFVQNTANLVLEERRRVVFKHLFGDK